MADKVALAYSGGLDTSIIIPWLKENYGCEVVAVCGDIGQGGDDRPVDEKARKTGASKVVDRGSARGVRRRLPLADGARGRRLRAQVSARHLDRAPAARQAAGGSRAGRGRDALAHGCTGKGNDQVRFELTYKALAPQLPVIAPWREWTSSRARTPRVRREAQRADLRSRPRRSTAATATSGTSRTKAARSKIRPTRRSGRHLDAHEELAAGSARQARSEVTIGFEKGMPVSVDGMQMHAVRACSSS